MPSRINIEDAAALFQNLELSPAPVLTLPNQAGPRNTITVKANDVWASIHAIADLVVRDEACKRFENLDMAAH